MEPIFSRRDVVEFRPVLRARIPATETSPEIPEQLSPRTYILAPLTYRERQAFRADMATTGGLYPSRPDLLAAMRAAIREIAPENEAELLAAIDAAQADPTDIDAQSRLQSIENMLTPMPSYAALVAARARYEGMLPFVAARHCLRGWEGPGLPPFARVRGLVPEELLDLIPDEELQQTGWRASALMQPPPAADRFSEAPSPSPESPAPSTAA